MSKRINVNPGQYKVAGRERPGKDLPEPERSPGTGGSKQQKAGPQKQTGKKR
jgi:hypothetical protein